MVVFFLRVYILLLLSLPATVLAAFNINTAQTHLQEGVYLLNADLDYKLTEETVKALNSGVPLTLVLSVEVDQERWYWDKNIALLKQRYRLRYYSLTSQYRLTYLNTGIQENFSDLADVLKMLNRLKDFPLLDEALIENEEGYWVYLRILLDIEALPAPLRPTAYFSSQWHLVSDWYKCALEK